MKLPILLLALCASALANLRAASPERVKQSSIGLTAQLVASSARAVDKFKTGYGSSDIHTDKSRTVAASVRNFGREPAAIHVITTWIGKHTGTNVRTVLRNENHALTLGAGEVRTLQCESGEVKGNDLILSAIGERYAQGARIEGWVIAVRERATNALLAIKASDSHLQEAMLAGEFRESVPVNAGEVVLVITSIGTTPTGYLARTDGGEIVHIAAGNNPPPGRVRTHVFENGSYEYVAVDASQRTVKQYRGGVPPAGTKAAPPAPAPAANALPAPPARVLPPGVVNLAFTTAEQTATGMFVVLGSGEVIHIATSTAFAPGLRAKADLRETGGIYEYTGKDGVVRRVKEYAGTAPAK